MNNKHFITSYRHNNFKRYSWKYTILTKYQQFWSQMMPWLKNNFENIFEIKWGLEFLKCLETLFRYQIWKNILKLPPIIILNNIPNIILMFVGGRTGSDFTEYCFLIWLFAHLYVATVGNHVLYHQKEMNSPWNMKRYNSNRIEDFLLGPSVNDVTHFLIFFTPPFALSPILKLNRLME